MKMKRIITGTLALGLLASGLMFASEGAKSTKAAKAKKKASPDVTLQLQELKDQLARQQQQVTEEQQQILQLQRQLQAEHQANQQLQSGVQTADQAAKSAAQAAASAQQAANAATASAADVKMSTMNLTQTLQKDINALQNPTEIRFRGVKLAPYGWTDLTAIYKSRNDNSDQSSSFSGIPLDNQANASMPLYKMTARSTRLGLTVTGNLTPKLLVTGVVELDFLSTTVGSSDGLTNSFSPRWRIASLQVDSKGGTTITAGVFWGLWTPNRAGADPRRVWGPTVIETNNVAGYAYRRAPAIRITQSFLKNKMWAAFSVEGKDYTYATGGVTPISVLGLAQSVSSATPTGNQVPQFSGTNAQGASVSNISGGEAPMNAPDLNAKLTFEPGFGHYELRAVGSFYRDRVATNAAGMPLAQSSSAGTVQTDRLGTSNTSISGGVGMFALVPVVKNKVDFVLMGQGGKGIGSYQTTTGTDVTLDNNLKLVPIKVLSGISGFEFHPTPKLDVYLLAGIEYYQRTKFAFTAAQQVAGGFTSSLGLTAAQIATGEGYGSKLFAPGTHNREISHAAFSYFYRLYRGPFGTLQQGFNYNYMHRTAWAGTATATTPATLKGFNNTGMLQLRYILP